MRPAFVTAKNHSCQNVYGATAAALMSFLVAYSSMPQQTERQWGTQVTVLDLISVNSQLGQKLREGEAQKSQQGLSSDGCRKQGEPYHHLLKGRHEPDGK